MGDVEGGGRWFRTRGGQPGPLARAVGSLPEREGRAAVTLELARACADVGDAARRAQDPKLYFSATDRLEKLLDRLEGRPGGRGGDPGTPARGRPTSGDELDPSIAAALDGTGEDEPG